MAIISLPGGRGLDVAVSGPEDGPPLIFHHGTPGSKVALGEMKRVAHAQGLRLVTYSRAGYGASSRLPGRSVAQIVPDVAAILDQLGASRCVVAGWSGGGPHALATAAGLPDRVAGVLVIAGVAPYGVAGLEFMAGMGEQNVAEFGLALRGEDALRPSLRAEADGLRSTTVADMVEQLATLLPDVDRAALDDEYGQYMIDSFAEGLRAGVDGWIDDDLAFVRPWGFALEEIAVPSFVWQGGEDLMVPPAHGRWLAGAIPGVTAHLEPGQGHLSVGLGRTEAMFQELTSTLPKAA